MRVELWKELNTLGHNLNLPWLTSGDFNKVFDQTNKWGGQPVFSHLVAPFKDMVHACNMVDLGFSGPKYTWTNSSTHSHDSIMEICPGVLLIRIGWTYFLRPLFLFYPKPIRITIH